MNRKPFLFAVFAALALLLVVSLESATAQGPKPRAPRSDPRTTFTYQGRLTDGGVPANGVYDFEFKLFDAWTGGAQVGSTKYADDVSVSNGLFTVELDFGGVFTGAGRHLQIGVRPGASGGAYTTLAPRQELTPAPYAQALFGLYTQQNATSPNLIGGYDGNSVTSGVIGATIGGGGYSGFTNRVTDNYGTVGGGSNNRAGDNGATTSDNPNATVGGGVDNTAGNSYTTVGGGAMNTAGGPSATVGGGQQNIASGATATVSGGTTNTASGVSAAVGGGYGNIASNQYATVGGGYANTANATFAAIPGGRDNVASGNYSFAAGRRAKANHNGAFVWGDSTDADVTSTAPDQFVIRASRGVSLTVDAGPTMGISIGERYRDNAIVAWASVYWNGNIDKSFGVQSVTKLGTGQYRITLYASAASDYGLIPVATPEIDTAPTSAAALRIVSINQINSKNIFEVYINDGAGNSVDNDFTVIVTAR